jgi:hypothetical protein
MLLQKKPTVAKLKQKLAATTTTSSSAAATPPLLLELLFVKPKASLPGSPLTRRSLQSKNKKNVITKDHWQSYIICEFSATKPQNPLERKKGEKKLELVHESSTATNKERRIQNVSKERQKKLVRQKGNQQQQMGDWEREREKERESHRDRREGEGEGREKTRESVSSLLEKWDLQNKNCSSNKAA